MTRIIPGGMADGKESLPRQFMADILPASFNSQDCEAKCNPPTTHRTGHLIYITGAKKCHKLPMKVYVKL